MSSVLIRQALDQTAARHPGAADRAPGDDMALPAPLPRPQPGLLLYVSLPEGTAHAPADLAEVAEILREFATELLPGSDTYTALSLAAPGSDEVHRLGDRLTHLRLVGDADRPG
ncbi:hypothetical protein [uncultured Cellulomonas sp.]|uniref:hypothetical protein n=1 Tax=uncultured Cellulomonas sp. TaxID=189682 RepID=UPI0028EF8DD9|nr:hypothetical protein [uncultured Cellulomonas sp.]